MIQFSPDFRQLFTIMRDPNQYFDILESYLKEFNKNYVVDREKTLQNFYDVDIADTAAAGIANLFGPSYEYPQSEHFWVFAFRGFTGNDATPPADFTPGISLPYLKGDGALLNASTNGVVTIRDWRLRGFLNSSEVDQNPGVQMLGKPQPIPGQENMRVDITVPSGGAAGDKFLLERHGLRLVS